MAQPPHRALGQELPLEGGRGDARGFSAANLTDGDRRTYWAADDDARQATLTVNLGAPARFNRIRIQEHIPLDQRIAAFSVEVPDGGQWKEIASGKTAGPRRLPRFPAVTADRVRLSISEALACPTLSTFEIYMASAEEALERR